MRACSFTSYAVISLFFFPMFLLDVSRRLQPAYDLDNILSAVPSQHLSLQNASTSNTSAPQASASYAFQGMVAEPTKAVIEPRIEEFDYSSMFIEDHHFSDDLYL